MRKLLVLLAVAALPVCAQTYVNGYTKSDGSYVPGHYKSTPNETKVDNYSAKGNVNPYTGAKGTVDPYKVEPYKAPKVADPYKVEPLKVEPYKPYTPKY